jgi:hypothetical protein
VKNCCSFRKKFVNFKEKAGSGGLLFFYLIPETTPAGWAANGTGEKF